MGRAIELARRALGQASPNPAVGAVIYRDGALVGEGWTAPPGGPHAELRALRQAGERARGATLYVSLEPCCHQGRTPPCTEAIIAAGIARVCYALRDPDPRVDGRGAERLRAAGILVEGGIGADAAAEIVAPFAHWVRSGRPLVTLKYAMTLDGRIATRTGESRWITGRPARERVHELRAVADAILVGAGTVRADDPALTCRMAGAVEPRQALRVVLDSRGRLPLGARVFDPSLPGRTLVAAVEMPVERRRLLEARGVEILRLPADPFGRVDLAALLDALGAREITDLLVEGGAAVHGAFLDERLAQRLAAFIAPKLVGGSEAPGPIGGIGVMRIGAAWTLRDRRVTALGEDLLLTGRLEADSPPAAAMAAEEGPGRQARRAEEARAEPRADAGEPLREAHVHRAG